MMNRMSAALLLANAVLGCWSELTVDSSVEWDAHNDIGIFCSNSDAVSKDYRCWKCKDGYVDSSVNGNAAQHYAFATGDLACAEKTLACGNDFWDDKTAKYACSQWITIGRGSTSCACVTPPSSSAPSTKAGPMVYLFQLVVFSLLAAYIV